MSVAFVSAAKVIRFVSAPPGPEPAQNEIQMKVTSYSLKAVTIRTVRYT